MATTIETQKVYRVTDGGAFSVPASRDDKYNTLQVYLTKNGETTGHPVQFVENVQERTVTVTDPYVVGDVIVVRCVPSLTTMFTKSARQSLTAAQINEMYEHLLMVASAANDKVLTEYGIVVLGDFNLDPADVALKAQTDPVAATVTDITGTEIPRLDARITALGTPLSVNWAIDSDVRMGTLTNLAISPATAKTNFEYRDVKGMNIVISAPTDPVIVGTGDVFTFKLPKFLDGYYVKDIEAYTATAYTGSNPCTVELWHDAVNVGHVEIKQNNAYADKDTDDSNNLPSTQGIVKGTDMTVRVSANADVVGLSLNVTFGALSSRYV